MTASGEIVTCSVCGAEVGRGPGGLGLTMHAKTHRREFRRRFGRWPNDYQEVRDRIGKYSVDPEDEQQTLWEALTESEQATFSGGV